jgi:hypothetical protein
MNLNEFCYKYIIIFSREIRPVSKDRSQISTALYPKLVEASTFLIYALQVPDSNIPGVNFSHENKEKS